MTNENVAKYARACEALRALDITVEEFIGLDMANCIATWRNDLGETSLGTADDILEMHLDTGYFLGICAKGLELCSS